MALLLMRKVPHYEHAVPCAVFTDNSDGRESYSSREKIEHWKLNFFAKFPEFQGYTSFSVIEVEIL